MNAKIPLVLLILIAAIGTASAAEYYVSPTGSGSRDGSQENAFNLSESISYANSHTSEEITFLLANGNYGIFSSTDPPNRTAWATWKAETSRAANFSGISVGRTGLSPNRNAYMAFEGLSVSGSAPVRTYRVNHVQIKDSDIQCNSLESDEGIYPWGSTNITIEGNDIHHCFDCIMLYGSDNTAKDNDIYDVGRDGIRGSGHNILIEGNEIHQLHGIGHADGIQMYTETGPADNMRVIGNHVYDGQHSQGIFITVENVPWTNLVVANNLIHDIATPSNFLTVNGTDSAYVYNNTVLRGVNRPGSGVATIRTTNHRDTVVEEMYNNVFETFILQADNPDAVAWVKEHGNNIFGNSAVHTSGRTHPFQPNLTELTNVTMDNSFFESPSSMNYRLAAGSVAIDFGNPSFGLSTDIEGNPRDALPDAGAYELQGGSPPTECRGTDTHCGIYPNCEPCPTDGCIETSYRDYSCSGTSCTYNEDSCTDCSCSCEGYNTTESPGNANCSDSKDNDCDGQTDSDDTGCNTSNYLVYIDFEEGRNGTWTEYNPGQGTPSWTIVNDSSNGGTNAYQLGGTVELVGNSDASILGAYSMINGVEIADFEFTGSLRSTRDTAYRDLGIIFGYQNEDQHYIAIFNNNCDDSTNGIFRVSGGVKQKIGTPCGQGVLNDLQYHQIKITKHGNSIEVFFDDMATPVFTATDSTYGTGSFGVGSVNDTGNFDNITITDLGEECVTMQALLEYIGQWKQGQIGMSTLIEKIAAWKTGC